MCNMCQVLMNLYNNIKKLFIEKDYLRNMKQCNRCGKPCLFNSCLSCETDEAYRGWGK